MEDASVDLVKALRTTADRIESGARFQWGHMGSCNCGHLAQTLTRMSRAEIHRKALARAGDWGAQTVDYCPTSGFPLDHIIDTMLAAGLKLSDLTHLENLSDARVLRSLPKGQRHLRRHKREDAVLYFRAWADVLDGDRPAAEIAPFPATGDPERAVTAA